MHIKHLLTWQATVLALPLSLMNPATSLAQLDAPLSLGPPPCSLDNPQFNENVDAGRCSTSDILSGLATLPAPGAKPSQDTQVTVESAQERQEPPTVTAVPSPIPESTSPASPTPVVSPPPLAQAPLPQSLPQPQTQPLPQPAQVATAPQPQAGSRENAQPERDNVLLVLFILLGLSVLALAALLILPALGVDNKSDQ